MTIPPSSLKRPLTFNLQRELSSTTDSSLRVCLRLSCLTFSITMSPPSNPTWRCTYLQRIRPQIRRVMNWDSCLKSSFIFRQTRLGLPTPKTKTTQRIKGPKTTYFWILLVQIKWRNSLTNTYTFALILRFWTSVLLWPSSWFRAARPKTKSNSANTNNAERTLTRRLRIILIQRSRIIEQCLTWWRIRDS